MTRTTTTDSTTNDLLDELYALRNYGGKLDLSGTEALCALFDHPHTRYPSIHVAGTNGKGTTCSICASVLAEAGFRVGLYTSPHIVRFNERVRICTRERGASEISDEDITRIAARLMPTVRENGASFFEATTTLAFQYFAEQHVDIAIMETGLGGRLDCTNVLRPETLLLTVATSIDLDHQEYLGDTLEAIAHEKAGIFKAGIPALVAEPRPELRSLFAERATHTASPLIFVKCEPVEQAIFHQDFSMELPLKTSNGASSGAINETSNEASSTTNNDAAFTVTAPLCGEHQVQNIQTAYDALRLIAPRFPTSNDDFQRGLDRLKRNTGLAARIELLSQAPHQKPLTVLDVGHNPAGLLQLRRTLELCGYGGVRWNVVFAAMREKHLDEMLDILQPITNALYVPQLRIERARPAHGVASAAQALGIAAQHYASTAEAMAVVCSDGAPVLVVGSFYLAEEVLEWW